MISGKDIAIIASVDIELMLLSAYLGIERLKFQEPAKKGNIILCLSGVGMVNGAIAATLIIERYAPSLIISTGICGAYTESGLEIGDISFAETEIYGDTGVVFDEDFQSLKEIALPIIKKDSYEIFNEIPVRNSYREKFSELCKDLGLKFKSGRFVTVAAITGTPEKARRIAKRWNAICENMEGAGIAHVAFLNNIDFIEIRGVSNRAGERDKGRWNIKVASENCQKLLIRFINWYGFSESG